MCEVRENGYGRQFRRMPEDIKCPLVADNHEHRSPNLRRIRSLYVEDLVNAYGDA